MKRDLRNIAGAVCRLLIGGLLCLGMSGAALAQIIDQEDFGTGPYPGAPLSAGQTSYNYNAPAQPANFPAILEDGDYVLATDSQQGFSNWSSIGDHTTGAGYMMLVNADDNQSGEFYRRQVSLTANTKFDFLAYLVTVNSQADFDYCTANEGGLVLPNVTLQIEDNTGAVLASADTGDIPFNATPAWDEYKLVFTTSPSTTVVDVVLINNSLGGCGNDLAIDDITFRVAVTMEASGETVTLTDTAAGQNAVLVLGTNDTLDGNPLPGTENYSVASGSTLPAGLSLNANTGEVDIAAGTPEGTYSFDYRVCETDNYFNCATATATVIVDFPPLAVTVDDDAGAVADSAAGFTAVLNVLDNDAIDGVSPPSDFTLLVSTGSSVPPGLTFNTNTGAVGVLSDTPAGIYSFDYDLCEPGDPGNCETATVTITVGNSGGGSFCPAGTSEIAGTYYVVSATGNDNHNPERAVGMPLAEGTSDTGANTAITYFGAITMDLTGAAGTLVPEGEAIDIVLSSAWNNNARAEILMSADGVTYTSLGTTGNGGSQYGNWTSNILRYDAFIVPAGGARFLRVSRQAGGVRADGVIYNTQCQAAPPSVTADDDAETIEVSAAAQTGILSVIDNDSFDGLTPTDFDLAIEANSTLPPELTFDAATGEVGAAAGAPAGIYSFDYELCEAGTNNCDIATVTITIAAPANTTINAYKSVAVYDPDGLGLYAVPGNDVIYTISVESAGNASVDTDTMLLIDKTPNELSFYNADIDDAAGPEINPVTFDDNASTLIFTYATDVAYAQGPARPANFAACNYTPAANSYDPNVSYICFNPKGAMAPDSNWSVSFRMRIQ